MVDVSTGSKDCICHQETLFEGVSWEYPRFQQEDKRYLLALSQLPGMTCRRLARLFAHCSNPSETWELCRGGAKIPGIFLELRMTWKEKARSLNPEEEEQKLKAKEINFLVLGEEGYPGLLDQIYDPPWLLFYKGSGAVCGKGFRVAMVGARKASAYGQAVCERLARDLVGNGVVVVSGAAQGIDSAAHRGALAVGGPTIAVLGCGVDVVYPRTNRRLFREIEEKGLLISEYPPGTEPAPYHFPARNRIIAGLCAGVVVVEAGKKSGALITADFALEEGREVFAVPGSVNSSLSKGCHMLLRMGAVLVEEAEDVIGHLSPFLGGSTPGKPETGKGSTQTLLAGLGEVEQSVLLAMGSDPVLPEEIAVQCQLPYPKVMASLTRLEVLGLVCPETGGRFLAVSPSGIIPDGE